MDHNEQTKAKECSFSGPFFLTKKDDVICIISQPILLPNLTCVYSFARCRYLTVNGELVYYPCGRAERTKFIQPLRPGFQTYCFLTPSDDILALLFYLSLQKNSAFRALNFERSTAYMYLHAGMIYYFIELDTQSCFNKSRLFHSYFRWGQ